MLWELWEDADGCGHTFIPSDNSTIKAELLAEAARLVWTVEVRSSNDAMRARNDHLGFGPYQPMLQPDGTPYPEDEADLPGGA